MVRPLTRLKNKCDIRTSGIKYLLRFTTLLKNPLKKLKYNPSDQTTKINLNWKNNYKFDQQK